MGFRIQYWYPVAFFFAVVAFVAMCFLTLEVRRLSDRIARMETGAPSFHEVQTSPHRDESGFPTVAFAETIHAVAGSHVHASQRRLDRFTNIKPYATADLNSGCVSIDLSYSPVTLDLSTLACNSNRCPSCFVILQGSATNDFTISSCSTMHLSNTVQLGNVGAYNIAVAKIIVINQDASTVAKISYPGATLSVPANTVQEFFCHSQGSNLLMPGTAYIAKLDDAPIGGETPSTGSFTVLQASGDLRTSGTSTLKLGYRGTATLASNSLSTTLNAQVGVIISTDLLAGSSKVEISVQNSVCTANSIVLATAVACTDGHAVVTSTTAAAGSFIVEVTNLDSTGCATAHKIQFAVFPE